MDNKAQNSDSECMRVLRYLLDNHDGSDHSLLAIQRTMWRIYKYPYMGYNVKEDKGFQ